ncbi:MAG: C4-dicarboxylate ABC transporter, partial [Desulfobacteraceae bacterium]|nr:C4-dicarboxylate ABC transporter [Desulfobacteraceae bacterium]
AERDKWAKKILPIRNEWIQDVKGKGINGERLLERGVKLMSEKSK